MLPYPCVTAHDSFKTVPRKLKLHLRLNHTVKRILVFLILVPEPSWRTFHTNCPRQLQTVTMHTQKHFISILALSITCKQLLETSVHHYYH